jgi:alkanesulfonate monooxygenase SsuD/methylene tetrahydromethanopterin reductase-like flavin-dependent oxidoreductase (luciferase family)
VSDDAALVRQLRERLSSAPAATGKQIQAPLDEWAVIGDPQFVTDKLAEYRELLKATEIVVTRLRLDGIEESKLRASIAKIIELI